MIGGQEKRRQIEGVFMARNTTRSLFCINNCKYCDMIIAMEAEEDKWAEAEVKRIQ